jgi:hypothetical protein
MSDQPAPAPGISIRRRGLIAPTQALAPSPTASLTALVQSGRDVPAIAEALGVSPDEARSRLDGIGLLDVVEPPASAPAEPSASAAPTQGGLASLLAAPAPAQEAPESAPAPSPVQTSPAATEAAERRGRKPGRPSAATPSSTGLGVGYFAGVYGAADYEALGRLYARALEEGTTVESIVANARLLVELADRLRLR